MEAVFLNSPNYNQWLWVLLLITARFYGAMYICPLFNTNLMTKMLKILLSFILAILFFPYLQEKALLPDSLYLRLLLLIKELLFGALLSFLFSLPIWLVESIGNLVDMQRGEQLGAIINKVTDNPSSSISQLLLQGYIVYIISINGLLFFFTDRL